MGVIKANMPTLASVTFIIKDMPNFRVKQKDFIQEM